MMKQNILLPIFIVSFIFFSCNKKNKSNPSTINSIDVKYDSAITAKNQIIIPKISMPNTVVLEADLSIQSESFSQDISAKFKFKNEDTTWISITGIFGIEGARILITKDTFHLLDRINRKYITGPVSMSKKLLPIQLDLNSFQSLIMGYAAYAIDSSFFSSYEKDTLTYEKNQRNIWCKTNWCKNNLIGFTEKDLTSGYKIFAHLADHKQYSIPYKRQYIISNNQHNYNVTYKVTSVEINKPIDFKFDVPNKYEKVVLSE